MNEKPTPVATLKWQKGRIRPNPKIYGPTARLYPRLQGPIEIRPHEHVIINTGLCVKVNYKHTVALIVPAVTPGLTAIPLNESADFESSGATVVAIDVMNPTAKSRVFFGDAPIAVVVLVNLPNNVESIDLFEIVEEEETDE